MSILVSRSKPQRLLFRAPSEHKVDGTQYDLEMQFLHTNKKGDEVTNVLAFFFDQELGGKDENEFLNSYFAAVDSSDGSEASEIELLNLF